MIETDRPGPIVMSPLSERLRRDRLRLSGVVSSRAATSFLANGKATVATPSRHDPGRSSR